MPGFARSVKAPNVPLARFALKFSACFLIGLALLLTPPIQFIDGYFSRLLVHLSDILIRFFGGAAIAQAAVLRHPVNGFAVEMRDGCNAVNVTLLLWSAVLAFPASWRWRGFGLLAGSLIIQAINLVRFISLFYLGQYSMTWFDFAHGYLWESMIVLDTMVVFWIWVNRVGDEAKLADAVH